MPDDLLPIVTRREENTPPTKNDAATARRVRSAFTANLGGDILLDEPRKGMGAENFAYFVDPKHGVRGVYFGVGGTPLSELPKAASHHSPFFKISPEPSVTLGVEAMTIAALELFSEEE